MTNLLRYMLKLNRKFFKTTLPLFKIGSLIRYANESSLRNTLENYIRETFTEMISKDILYKLNIADKTLQVPFEEMKQRLVKATTPQEKEKIYKEYDIRVKQVLKEVKASQELITFILENYQRDIPISSNLKLFSPTSPYIISLYENTISKIPNFNQLLDTIITSPKRSEKKKAWSTLVQSFISTANLTLKQPPDFPDTYFTSDKTKKEKTEKRRGDILDYYDIAFKGLKLLLEKLNINPTDLDTYMKEYLSTIETESRDITQIKFILLKGLFIYLKGKVDKESLVTILKAFEEALNNINKTYTPVEALRDIAQRLLTGSTEKDIRKFLSLYAGGLEKVPPAFIQLRKKLNPVPTYTDSPQSFSKGKWVFNLIQLLNNIYLTRLKKFLELPSVKELLTSDVKEKIGLTPEVEKIIQQPWSSLRYKYDAIKEVEKDLEKNYPDMSFEQKKTKIQQILKDKVFLEDVVSNAQEILDRIKELPSSAPLKQKFIEYMTSYFNETAFIKDIFSSKFNKDLANLMTKHKAGRSVSTISLQAPLSEESEDTLEKVVTHPEVTPDIETPNIPLTMDPNQLTELILETISDNIGYDISHLRSPITELVNSTLSSIKEEKLELTLGSFFKDLDQDLLNILENAEIPVSLDDIKSILYDIGRKIRSRIVREKGLGEKAVAFILGQVRAPLLRLTWLPPIIKTDIRSLVNEFVYKGEEGANSYLASNGLHDIDQREKIINNYLVPARSNFQRNFFMSTKLFEV